MEGQRERVFPSPSCGHYTALAQVWQIRVGNRGRAPRQCRDTGGLEMCKIYVAWLGGLSVERRVCAGHPGSTPSPGGR